MPIRFQCDNCGKSLKTDESKAGRQVKCPGCASMITIPNPEEDLDLSWNEPAEVDDAENPDRPKRSRKETATHARAVELSEYTLADPLRRLMGAFLDSLCGLGFCLPGIVCLILGLDFNEKHQDAPPVLAVAGIGLIVLGVIALLGTNLYLLATRSQSIAKYLLRMQIHDYETKQPASFMKCFVLRAFVNGLIGAVPLAGGIYSIADALFVFSAEHRCLHDHLAGTYVVNLP